MFGREITVPLDVMMADQETHTDHVEYGDVRVQLGAVQKRQKENYDKGIKEKQLKPGDRVLLFTPQLKPDEASKFHRMWTGPYVIKKKLTYVTYKIQKEGSTRSKVVHFNNLKLLPTSAERQEADEEVSDAEELPANQPEYELWFATGCC